MSSSLGTSWAVGELARATAQLSVDLAVHQGDADCRLVRVALDALDDLPNDPATLPDRDGVRLILSLAAHALDDRDNE
jgi:hypothetical protein